MNQLFEMFGPGLVLLITVIGVVIGIGFSGTAALGVIKRCKKENKPIPWIIFPFVGAPVVGAFYSNILLLHMLEIGINSENESILFSYTIGVGLIIALSMAIMGKLGAIACNELSEDLKRLNFHFIKIGAANAVAVFAMIFAMINMQ